MSMFDVFSIKTVVAGTGGAALGAGATHLIHKYTTVRSKNKLESRLGIIDQNDQEKAIKKVAILKALAYRDGHFCTAEKAFLYRYIIHSPDLQADIKVELAKELEDAPPTALGDIWNTIRETLSFSDIFKTEEEAAGFIHSMKQLASADGDLCESETKHILKVCTDCKIPEHLFG